MTSAHPALQSKYWALLDDAGADRDALPKALAALPPRDLVAFAAHVIVARNLVRHRDRPPVVDGVALDSLTLEDLTGWIVGKGEAAFTEAVGASDERLAALYAMYLDETTPDALQEIWRAYERRADDDLNDAVDRYLDALPS